MDKTSIYLIDAAKDLLLETCTILNSIGAEYAIVGGWTPYLLNKSEYPHPGTKDVDVLFRDGYIKGNLEKIFESFFRSDFKPSAKHPFQLLKNYTVGGHEFVFNVDVLHPSESKYKPEQFVDHFDFGIREVAGSEETMAARSIVLPSADIIFKGLSEQVNFSELTGRRGQPVHAHLMNIVGLIATKSESFLNKKRTRDSFDLFLAYNQPDFNLPESLERLTSGVDAEDDIQVLLEMMENFSKNIQTTKDRFNQNVLRYADIKGIDAAAFVSSRHAIVIEQVKESRNALLKRRPAL